MIIDLVIGPKFSFFGGVMQMEPGKYCCRFYFISDIHKLNSCLKQKCSCSCFYLLFLTFQSIHQRNVSIHSIFFSCFLLKSWVVLLRKYVWDTEKKRIFRQKLLFFYINKLINHMSLNNVKYVCASVKIYFAFYSFLFS